ncbi:hypothetical protein CPC08DRAFT_710695 [Agrocybe pediades]|nr:hypothetical protein CPC08DRAFT_710695 [Agrocybe pediades]
MSSHSGNPSKLSGQIQELKGELKTGVGSITGSTKMKASGEQDRIEGHSEVSAARHGTTGTNTNTHGANMHDTASTGAGIGTGTGIGAGNHTGRGIGIGADGYNQYDTGRGTGRGPNDHNIHNEITGGNTGYGGTGTTADRTSHTFTGGNGTTLPGNENAGTGLGGQAAAAFQAERAVNQNQKEWERNAF